MNFGTAQVIRANARSLPLADDSVDLVITSPPYFALRSYQDGGEHYAGQMPGTAARYAAGYGVRAVDEQRPSVNTKLGGDTYGENPLGKLPGSVWTVPTEPLIIPDEIAHAACCGGFVKRSGCEDGLDHYAAFPSEFPKRIISGWSPAGVCVECREGRRPVTHKKPMEWRPGPAAAGYNAPGTSRVSVSGTMLAAAETTITGYACACPEPTAPTTPAVVLDPFGGTGTTAMVAKALGRHGISVDMSADYCRLAEWRTNDPKQLLKVVGIRVKPTKRDPGLVDIFELDTQEATA